MSEASHIKIQIQAHGLAAMKCYRKSKVRINTYRPMGLDSTWYELCVYQNEDDLWDDSGIEVHMSREQLESLRNEIDKVLEGEE